MSKMHGVYQLWKVLWSIFAGFMAAQVVAVFMLFLFFRFGFNRPDKNLSALVEWGCTAIVVLTVPVVAVLQYRRQTAEDAEAEIRKNKEKFNNW